MTSEEEFGEERLLQVVRQNCYLSAEGLQSEIYQQILKFADKSGLANDITIVVLKVLQ